MPAKSLCSIEGCSNPAKVRGWCHAHYQRFLRHGDPNGVQAMQGEPERFFKEVVLKFIGDDCLPWPYTKANYGYGELRIGGRKTKKQLVHRVVCETIHGPAPVGKNDAAHSCGNRICCNPRHLRWASRAENVDDSRKHGTICRGEKQGQAKLSEAQVLEIRSVKDHFTHVELAQKFGVCRQTISDIIARKRWAWLKD